ncbi:MAG: trypsin-like peptidase domain-containing protein [Chloroflexi bacterium]|nr:trypsin-like peptidase domain-containing protein [Chloroflexota bacterium]
MERVRPAVASVFAESFRLDLFLRPVPQPGIGTGIVITPDGYIVTNSHIIEGAQSIVVGLPDGRSFRAKVVGADTVSDVAVIKIDAQGLTTFQFDNSDSLRVGDWVIAIGNALDLKGGPTVTMGIISAKGRTIDAENRSVPLYDLIQTDAAINEGNSGGPLINLKGEVVGINTAISREGTNIGFAISSGSARPIIDSLISNGRISRTWIGLAGQDVNSLIAAELRLPVQEGVLVTTMSSTGPAAQAGLKIGDVITKLDSKSTPDMATFLKLLWSYKVGDVAEVEYMRDGKANLTWVRLVERSS